MESSLSNINNRIKHDDSLAARLWMAIDHLHMSYLELDEGSAKIEQRAKLEDCIAEFLCLVSHDQKFTLLETFEVFHQSVANKKHFSGYKAATGWNTIQMYAGNLLCQPWRKEYYQLKLYCGFYKHQIEANLIGAEKMFEVMGYKQKGDGILYLDEPICPDRIANVSKDCIIAYVECQILKHIWEEVQPIQNISWLNILEFRCNHICDIEQCAKAIKCLWNQKEALRDVGAPLVSLSRINNSVNIPKSQTSYSQKLALLSGIPSMHQHHKVTCEHRYPTRPLINHSVPLPISSNGYYYANNSCTNKPYFISTEPGPEQNIELDKINVATPDSFPYNESHGESSKNGYEDWGYVYKNLEHQGYSKDLGERGDVLNLNLNQEKDSKPMSIPKQKSQNDQIDDKFKKEITAEHDSKEKSKWECPACTFMNTKVENSVCEMCSKSRYPAKLDPPMEIGGAECSKCTLVNPKNAKKCMACASSLENSPTYI